MDFLDDEFDEILRIFLVESEEIISRLNNNLLDLEKKPGDKDIILLLFRDAHSLKGASRMIGFNNIQNIAHKMEDILGLAKENKSQLSVQMIDILYKTVDFMAELIQKSVAAKQEVYDDDVEKQMDILENIQNYKDKTVAKKDKADINVKLLSENITEINASISNCLFILMRLQLEKDSALIGQLLGTTKTLYEIFIEVDFFEIKQELSNINFKLDFVNKATHTLTPPETEEIGQKFNFIIENLVAVCEMNNLEVIDFYSQALDAMSNFNKMKNGQSPETKPEKVEEIKLQKLEINDETEDVFDFVQEEKEEEKPEPVKKPEVSVTKEIIPRETTVSAAKPDAKTLLDTKEKIQELSKSNLKIDEVIDFISNFKKECSNIQVKQILEKIIFILDFSKKTEILLLEDNIDAILQGIDYCDNILNNISGTVDNSLILQRLEIVQQLLELKQSNGLTSDAENLGHRVNGKKIVDFSRIFDSGEIKTLRVDSSKLDKLVNQVGELIVAKMKTKNHLYEISEINQKLEDWQRNSTRALNHLKYYEKKYYNDIKDEDRPIGILLKQLLALQADNSKKITSAYSSIASLERMIQDDSMKMGVIIDDLDLMVKNVRVLPIATIFHMFGRMVRDIANEKNKKIDLEIIGSETCTDKKIIEEIKTPLIHIIRNSIDHGIETPEERIALGKPPVGKITLSAKTVDNEIVIEVEDDGRGINLEKVKEKAVNNGFLTREEALGMPDEQIMNIIFAPGFSTGDMVTDISGRGIGLDVVQTKIAQLNGKIKVISELNKGCCLRIELPTTMSTLKAFLVKASDQNFAIPLSAISSIVWKNTNEIYSSKDGRSIKFKDKTIPIYNLSDILKYPRIKKSGAKTTILIIGKDSKIFGLEVDKLVGEQDILHKKLSAPLYRIKNISGVTTLETGEICLILNMSDLLKTVANKQFLNTKPVVKIPVLKKQPKDYKILLIDDSITTRTLEKNILESVGYKVTAVSSPIDAKNTIKQIHFDLIISDVEMPEVSGLDFLKELKTNEMYSDIPFMFVSSVLNKENIKEAKKFGAVDYITKHDFNQQDFLNTVGKIVEKNQY